MTSRLASRLPAAPVRLGVVTLVVVVWTTGIHAQEMGSDSGADQVERVFKECKDAVVQVESTDQHGPCYGTGFFTDPSGTVFTLSAIVAGAEEINVIQGDRKFPAKLLVADPRSGVALLKVDADSSFIPLGDASKLEVATPVMTIGYADVGLTPSLGIIAGFDRKFQGKFLVTTHLRANLPVQKGFAGSPLLDMSGHVVGILMSGADGLSSCYALPIQAAEKIRQDYARFGEVRHGWVGVSVEDQEQDVEGSHARVTGLGADTPAAKSGLHDGDVLLQVGDVKVTSVEDILDASFFLTAGDQTAVIVDRGGQKLTFNIRSIRHPASVPTSNDLSIDPSGNVQVFAPDSATDLHLGNPNR